MKNNKPLIIIGIVALNLLVAFMIGQSLMGKASSYDVKLQEARGYAEKELCSKAIASYEDTIAIKDSPELRLEMIEVYKKGLEIGEFSNTYDIIAAIKLAIDKYRQEPRVYEAACDLLIKYGKYEDCADILMQARSLHVESETLTEYLEKVKYQYTKYYAMYTNVLPVFDGMYTVDSEGTYSFLNNEASPDMKGGYEYASSFAYGYAFVQTKEADESVRSFIINRESERQAYLDNVETSSGVGKGKDSDGNEVLLLACKVGESYKYFDMEGKELFGSYKYAGRFRNGIAAVQEADGKWKIINASGTPVVNKTFTNIILNEFDECSANGYIFADEGTGYHLYDYQTITQIGTEEFDDAKAFAGGTLAAVKKGDYWGFVDTEGKIVIDPQYEDARSFSNDMGAIYDGVGWKFINPQGEIVIQETFDDVGYLSEDGICFVKTEGYWSYLKFYFTAK